MSDRDEYARALGAELSAAKAARKAIWASVERLERRLERLEGRVRAAERSAPPAEPEVEVPAARAAERLGVSAATVRRLVLSGDLPGSARRLPGRQRRVWTVREDSLRALEHERGTSVTSDARKTASACVARGPQGG